MQLKTQGKREIKYIAEMNHYGCPKPKRFSDTTLGNVYNVLMTIGGAQSGLLQSSKQSI